jgi:hypothetical protein
LITRALARDPFDFGAPIVLIDAIMRQVAMPTDATPQQLPIRRVRFLSALTDLTNGKLLMA